MPREQINYPQFGVVIDPGDSGHPVGTEIEKHPSAIHVGWNRAGWVQLSLEADPSYFRFVADNPDGAPFDDGSQGTSAYSPVLNRVEINKLIRALRRARDQAYGRDE
jgi:hypothetical protein